ncbi:MAG TPA: ABC transporter permease [Solirubrobacteraceae bacterium]|jgi:putative ABC transport system permease protein|nr:ABC transporter permease [Solirubrobacteraceae bacterium]
MLLRLYWYRLRQQPAQEALALIGIAAGVALIFAVEIANTSVPASVRDLERGIAGGASVEVAARSPEGFEQGLVNKVGEAPGVAGDAGVLDARVTVVGPHGQLPLTLVGADAGITAIGGPLARNFPWRTLAGAAPAGLQPAALANRLQGAHVDTIALPEGAARALGASVGQLLSIDVAGRSVVVLCGGILSAQQVGAAAESPIAIALLPAVQRITGLTHRVTRILILPQHGREALARRTLTRLFGSTLNVRSSDSEVTLLEAATHSSNQVATLFTALSVIVGMLFAYNAMLLSLPGRRRYVTRLRNHGAYRYELASLMALEVLALGVVASLVGLALGDLLSGSVFGSVPGYLAAGFAIGTQRVITPVAVLVSIGGGMLAAIFAAIGPAIGTLRGRPLEQTSESEGESSLSLGWFSERAGLAVGVIAILATVAVALFVPGSSLVAVGALAIGLGFVLAPTVPWLIQRCVGVSIRLRSPAAYIAAIELKAAPMRATAVAATSAIAVYAIVAIGGTLNDIRRGAEAATRDIAGTASISVLATSLQGDPFPVQQFKPEPALARVRSVKDVAWVELLQGSFLDVDNRRLLVIAKPPNDRSPVPSSQIIVGSANRAASLLRRGGWAALSATVAAERGLHLGDPIVLPTPSGYARFRLAATITNYGWPPGAVLMNSKDYTRLWRTNSVTVMRMGLRPGVSVAQGRRAVTGALGDTSLVIGTAQQDEASIRAVTNQGLALLGQISTLLLISAVLAVVAVMSGSIWQRRGRLATLKRLGMSRGEMVGTIYLETGIVVLLGCAIGVVFGLGAEPLATQYIRESTGFPEIFSPAFRLGFSTLVVSTALAIFATGLLGYLVTRRSVMWRSVA